MEPLVFGRQVIYPSSSEHMDEIPDGSIDVIVTSPPYNVGKDYSAGGKRVDDSRDYHEYLDFLHRVFKECHRVASDRCLFFLNIGDSARTQGKSEDVARMAVKAGFKRLQTVIWVKSIFGKGHYTPSGGDRRLNNLWEYVFILYKTRKYEMQPKAIGIPYSDKSNIGRYADQDIRDAGDVWFIPYTKTTGHTIKKGHDAPFPIELPYRCLKLVKDPANVLDPFAGTGSTLRAAELLGIRGFGYELVPRVDVIKARMKEPLREVPTPLLPQLEFHDDFLERLVDLLAADVPPARMKNLLSASFSKAEKQRFAWACADLGRESAILDLLGNEKGPAIAGKGNKVDCHKGKRVFRKGKAENTRRAIGLFWYIKNIP